MTEATAPPIALAGLSVNNINDDILGKLLANTEAVHSVLIELKSMLRQKAIETNTAKENIHGAAVIVDDLESQLCMDDEKPSIYVSVKQTDKDGSEEDESEKPASGVKFDQEAFSNDNEIARKRHDQRRRLELLGLKRRISYKYISFPLASYQSEIASYDRTSQYIAHDPHHWWHRLHHRHHKPQPDPSHAHIGVSGQLRDELLDALFDFESVWPEYHFRHILPLRELEHTFGYKLYRIKSPSLGIYSPGTPLIIEIGRYFGDLGKALAEDNPEPSVVAVKEVYTLNNLYSRCLQRGVIGDIAGSESRQRKVAIQRIFHILRAFNHVANIPEDLQPLTPESGDMFILDLLDEVYERAAGPRVSVAAKSPHFDEDLHFNPKELGFKNLTELGGLKIAWTNMYSQHLRLIRSSKTLLLFWDVSILGQSPLFCHWPQWLNQKRSASFQPKHELDSYNVKSAGLIEELRRSYRIIFGNPDGRFLERFFKKHFRRSGDEVGIVLHDLETIMMGSQRTRVDVSRSSVKQALKYYLRAPLPTSVLALRPELDLKKHRGPRTKFNWHHFNFRGRTSGKLVDLLDASPPYPLDFWMHVSFLLELSQSSNLFEMERYSAYPIFADRLRELKRHMDKQRPKNLKQLFKDRRDTVGYWAFWAVVFVGGISIILTLVSIAVSSAQAVAGFKALKPIIAASSSSST